MSGTNYYRVNGRVFVLSDEGEAELEELLEERYGEGASVFALRASLVEAALEEVATREAMA